MSTNNDENLYWYLKHTQANINDADVNTPIDKDHDIVDTRNNSIPMRKRTGSIENKSVGDMSIKPNGITKKG